MDLNKAAVECLGPKEAGEVLELFLGTPGAELAQQTQKQPPQGAGAPPKPPV